jgi:uncharacterized protein (TIGR03067 family)
MLLLLTVALGLAEPEDKLAKIKAEFGKMEGTWQAVTVEENGTKSEAGDVRLVVKAGKFTLSKDGEEVFAGRLDVNPAGKTVDFVRAEDQDKLIEGLYTLDGVRLPPGGAQWDSDIAFG